jgi:SH3-like domain-containing protein
MRPVCGYFAALLGVVAIALTACATADPPSSGYLSPPPPPRMTDAPEGVRLYAGPSHSSQVVAVLPAGWDVRAVRREREWVLVKPAGEGETGWVYAPLPSEPKRPAMVASTSPPPVIREQVATASAPVPPDARPVPVPPPSASRPSAQERAALAAPATKASPPSAPPIAHDKVPPGETSTDRQKMSPEDIIRLLMKASMAGYPGNCACPDYSAKNGSRCGRRSAYCRPGGWRPLCYPSDVTPQMIKAFRENGNTAAALALQRQPDC